MASVLHSTDTSLVQRRGPEKELTNQSCQLNHILSALDELVFKETLGGIFSESKRKKFSFENEISTLIDLCCESVEP